MGAGLQTGLQRVGREVVDLLFPPLCVLCREPVGAADSLCPACWNGLQFIDAPICERCGLPFEIDAGPGTVCAACLAEPPDFDRARAILRYDDASKQPVLALKHADRLDLVPAFAKWLDRAGHDLFAATDLVVPVPLHRLRLWKRRYNQSAELARGLCRRTGLAFAPLLLERTKPTPSQGQMPSAAARRQNVAGAFRVPPDRRAALKGRKVLLVDDVLTTGATASACARVLKRAGATSVFVLALARVVRA
jgi:ComF family protein